MIFHLDCVYVVDFFIDDIPAFFQKICLRTREAQPGAKDVVLHAKDVVLKLLDVVLSLLDAVEQRASSERDLNILFAFFKSPLRYKAKVYNSFFVDSSFIIS